MEAKDTVMDKRKITGAILADEAKHGSTHSLKYFSVNIIELRSVARAQAGISFPLGEKQGYEKGRKARLKEVVDALREHESCDKWGNPCIAIGYNDLGNKRYFDWWQAQLKEWGL